MPTRLSAISGATVHNNVAFSFYVHMVTQGRPKNCLSLEISAKLDIDFADLKRGVSCSLATGVSKASDESKSVNLNTLLC